jgi:hypothetical protein
MDKKHERIGLGIVVPDSKEFVVTAQSTTRFFLVELVVAEALAALHTMEFSREMGFSDIIMEGDALQIVKTVKDMDPNGSTYGHIEEGIKMGLNQLRSSKIEHVKRDANKAAYTIAKETIWVS